MYRFLCTGCVHELLLTVGCLITCCAANAKMELMFMIPIKTDFS